MDTDFSRNMSSFCGWGCQSAEKTLKYNGDGLIEDNFNYGTGLVLFCDFLLDGWTRCFTSMRMFVL